MHYFMDSERLDNCVVSSRSFAKFKKYPSVTLITKHSQMPKCRIIPSHVLDVSLFLNDVTQDVAGFLKGSPF